MGGYHRSAALALLFVCAAGAAEADVPRFDAPQAGDGFTAAMLAGHNRARSALGLPTLAWDATLAQHARSYARQLADLHRLAHAERLAGGTVEGENLWAGTRGGYRYDEMVGGWLAERPVRAPVARGSGALHYSQIVWRRTTHVGCAMASDARTDYLVCRYSPAGNVIGGRAY